MSDLPSGWVEPTFLELFDIQGGTQPPKSSFIYHPQDGYIQLLQIRDFGERGVPTFIPDTLKLKKCRKEDILIARYGASLGRILSGLEGAYNVAMAKVVVPDELNRRYTFHLLNSELFQAPLRLVSRSAQNGFNKEDLASIDVRIAPRNEQNRIAYKVDALLARVDTCRERLDRLPAILKRFRQSVLDAATSGKLTEDWRAHSGEQGGKFALLGTLGKVVAGQSARIGEVNYDGKGELYVTGPEQWNGREIIADKWTEHPKRMAPDNSIFVTVKGAGVGKTFPGRRAAIGRDVYAFVPDAQYDHRYVLYAIQSSVEAIIAKAQGLIPGLSKSHLTEHRIYVPPLSEQQQIVRRVDSLFAYADRLQAYYNAAREQVERLTPAVLAKAFRGELVPQDPNDQPASALLERIRAARAVERVKVKPPGIGRGPSMAKITTESLRDIIRQLPHDRFTFDDLRARVSVDYESLKEFVFVLLSETRPSVRQVFNAESRAIEFLRVNE